MKRRPRAFDPGAADFWWRGILEEGRQDKPYDFWFGYICHNQETAGRLGAYLRTVGGYEPTIEDLSSQPEGFTGWHVHVTVLSRTITREWLVAFLRFLHDTAVQYEVDGPEVVMNDSAA